MAIRPDLEVPVHGHEAKRRIDRAVDHGYRDPVRRHDRLPVVHAGTAERIHADPRAEATELLDHVCSGMPVILNENWPIPCLLQRGTRPLVVGEPHAVDLCRRTHGRPSRAEPCVFGSPIAGTWGSSLWQPEVEFETDTEKIRRTHRRRGSRTLIAPSTTLFPYSPPRQTARRRNRRGSKRAARSPAPRSSQ